MTTTAITGIGVVAPNGLGTEEFWSATLRGESGIGAVQRFDVSGYPARLGGELTGFDPADHLPSRLIPQTDRMTQIALAASDWAFADARLEPGTYDSTDMGVTTAGAFGGFEYGQRELDKLWTEGPEHVSVYMSFAWFYAVNTGQISIRHSLRGPAGVVVSDQAGGLDSVAQARRNIRKGARLVVSGGVDSSFCPYGWVSRMSGGGLSTGDDPRTAYLPFDVRAQGHVPGEGGAILVTEDAGAARARGARVYGEIAGYGATFDAAARHGGEPGVRRAVETALADAGIGACDIGVVFADGSGTPEADQVEAEAIEAVFGPGGVPVTAPKTMTGRMSSGGAPADLACALLAMRDGLIPPTVNVRTVAAGSRLDLVLDEPRPWQPGPALVIARGRGGFNSAMVLRP
ncbi:ketosynthase chain-length factor [Streptomyces uncialis]|uniref:ketosynthase chain-length factor n=1 Tax=Streptomyces uncialis TaxID=1048205 RepID=UPI002E335249|nr:ketosynthase chain-length factor [Streptomyces uncialis]WTE12844.1 ketosynthase chain-length factor [Streptomyces uncialis]